MVLGHSIAYDLIAPSASRRGVLLRDTGHVYWNAAVAMGLVAAVWAIATHAHAEFRRHRHGAAATETLWQAGRRLALWQVGAFTVMESLERATSHAPVSSMFSHHLFVIGAVVQVAVAAVLVQALRLVGEVAVAVARVLAPRRTPFARARVTRRVELRPPRSIDVWHRAGPSRAPPAVA